MKILVADGYSRYSRPMILMLIDYLLYTYISSLSLRPLFVFTTSHVRNKTIFKVGRQVHLVLGLCVFSFLGKTAYCKNRIYGEKKSPKFLNIFCSPLMSIIREPFVFIQGKTHIPRIFFTIHNFRINGESHNSKPHKPRTKCTTFRPFPHL